MFESTLYPGMIDKMLGILNNNGLVLDTDFTFSIIVRQDYFKNITEMDTNNIKVVSSLSEKSSLA